jgi:hypothetical protein
MFRTILLIGLIFFVFGGATAGIIKVPDQYTTIQAGINAAFPDDTVLVVDGTYYENIDFKGKAITVASYYLFDDDTTHVDSTIIDGSRPADPNKGSVVSFVSGEDTTSVLYGFTITGGSGWWRSANESRAGGGIYCYYAGCKIIANKIINNSVTGPLAMGGGLAALPYDNTAYVVLKENQIAHNTVTANSGQAVGGGVWLLCNAKIAANSISYNTCNGTASSTQAFAGGICCLVAQPLSSREIIMENNAVTHNSVRSYCNAPGASPAFSGGALIQGCNGRMTKNEISFNEVWDYSNLTSGAIGVSVGNSPDSFIIEGNIIRENAEKQGTSASYGGGMQVAGTGFISIINNIIEGNFATYGGGVLIFDTSTAQIVNNTIINNRATYGGGISVHDATGYVMNTIVWGNQATTHPGIHVESGSIKVAYSDVQGGWSGTGNINADPQFMAGDSLYHHLTPSSSNPCVNAGIDSLLMDNIMIKCPLDDYESDDGFQRPYLGTLPDIGADETDVVTGIEPVWARNIPMQYALSQNYPNPFNPNTTIEFSLPKSTFVTLKVYNLLGKEVATLVAEEREAGTHKLNWDARGLVSGMYVYRLEAGEFVQTRKLILLR